MAIVVDCTGCLGIDTGCPSVLVAVTRFVESVVHFLPFLEFFLTERSRDLMVSVNGTRFGDLSSSCCASNVRLRSVGAVLNELTSVSDILMVEILKKIVVNLISGR